MDKETAKAINDLSKKINGIETKLDRFFNNRADENKENITVTQNGLVETFENTEINAQSIIDVENSIVEIYEMLESEVE